MPAPDWIETAILLLSSSSTIIAGLYWNHDTAFDSINNSHLIRFLWLLTNCKRTLTPCHFLTVLSPKVLGIAIARYDFCARDMRELSLLKGDVVKIYTKMSANGWWRGEVNGRVSWSLSKEVNGRVSWCTWMKGTEQLLAPIVVPGRSLHPVLQLSAHRPLPSGNWCYILLIPGTRWKYLKWIW